MLLDDNQIIFDYSVGAETIRVTLRQPTPTELDTFLRDRYVAKGRKMENHTPESRRKLIDKILVDIEGLQFRDRTGAIHALGAAVSLDEEEKAYQTHRRGHPVTTWRDLVPSHWKNQWAARFEETEGEIEDVPLPN